MSLSFNEILILDYFKNKTTDREAPISKLDDFGKDYKKVIEKLLSMNYMQLLDISDEIKYLTIPILKSILKTKSLKVSGNKKILLTRILDNFTTEELINYVDKRHYILTTLGEKTLKDSELYLLNYSVAKFPIKELQEYEKQAKENVHGIQPIEILYSFAQKKTLENLNKHDFRSLHQSLWAECYCVSALKNEILMLRNNLRLIILDLSGLSNCIFDRNFTVDPYDLIYIPLGIVDNIKTVIEDYELNDKTVYDILMKTIDTELSYLPFHYFSKNSLLHILSMCIYDKVPDLKKVQPDFLPLKEWTYGNLW